MTPQAIIAKLEQHIDAERRGEIRAPDSLLPAGPGAARQALLEMAMRKKQNDASRVEEFDRLRRIMQARKTTASHPRKAVMHAVPAALQSHPKGSPTAWWTAATSRLHTSPGGARVQLRHSDFWFATTQTVTTAGVAM